MVQRLKNDGTFENVYPPQTSTPTAAAYIDLAPGEIVAFVMSSPSAGLVRQLDLASGASIQDTAVSTGTSSLGPFSTARRFLLICAVGSIASQVMRATSVGGVGIGNPSAGPVFNTPDGGAVPSYWRRRMSSTMYLGDSLTAAGGHIPIAPANRATQVVFPTFTNINSVGIFVVSVEVGPTTPTGDGTLRYYADTMSFTWQANGDTEGVRVPAPTSGFYALPSGTGGEGSTLFISAVGRMRPLSNKSDTITTNSGLSKYLKNNYATNGFMGWTNALIGPALGKVYCYGISTIRASDWLAAKDQWRSKFTDVTVVHLGTNDISDQTTATQALVDVTEIVRLRQAIGSTVILGCLFPYNSRSAAQTAAVLWYNRALRDLGERLNIDVFDAWPYLADPVGTGGYATGMTIDGLHPASLGGYVIAKRTLVPIMRKYVTPLDTRQFANSPYVASTAPYGNLLTNGIQIGVGGALGTGASGEVPNSWTAERNSGSAITIFGKTPDSASPTLRTDGQLGKYATYTITNTGGANGESVVVRQTAFISAANFAVGDYVQIEGDLRITGTGIAYLAANGVIGIRQFLALTSQTDSIMGALDGDVVTLPFRSDPMIIEAGDTNMSLRITVGMQANGVATLDVGQTLTLHKVPPPV